MIKVSGGTDETDVLTIKMTASKLLERHFLTRFHSFIEYIFQQYYKGGASLERIEGGFIAFCRNKELFSLLFLPFPPNMIKKLREHPMKYNRLFEPLISKEDFMKDPVYIDLEFLNADPHEFLSMIEALFNPIDSNIDIIIMPPHIMIYFRTWESYKLYMDLIAETYKFLSGTLF